MTKDQTKEIKEYLDEGILAINRRLDVNQKSLDVLFSDLGEDRKNLGQLLIHMETLIKEVREVKELFGIQTNRIANKVEDHLEAAVDDVTKKMVSRTKDAVEDTLDEFVAGRPKVTKRQGLITKIKQAFRGIKLLIL